MEGTDSIGSALKELGRSVYIVHNRLRNSKGKIIDVVEYVIYETLRFPEPDGPDEGTPDPSCPDTGKTDMDNPYLENRPQLNKEKRNPEEQNYEYLIQNHQLDRDRLNKLVELIVDAVCSRWETIRIAGDDYPAEVVKSRFLKLNSSHIEYVLDRMRENTTYIRNIKKYLLAALYNAPATIGSYYTSLVSHDLCGK